MTNEELDELMAEYSHDAVKCKAHGDKKLAKVFSDTAKALRELKIHRATLEHSAYHLLRNGSYMSGVDWDRMEKMMARSWQLMHK